jgi:hypothetical protein
MSKIEAIAHFALMVLFAGFSAFYFTLMGALIILELFFPAN